MRAENELDEATAADDDRNPFAPPERVDDAFDARPTVGPSFFGAFWYCLRRSFDFKGRANRTEYFGWLAGLAVALFALGFVVEIISDIISDDLNAPKAGRINDILWMCGLAVSLAATIPGAAVSKRRRRDRNGGKFLGDVAAFGVAFLFAVGYVGAGEGGDGVFAILTAALIYAVASTLFWGPSIFLTGYCYAAWATIPGKERPGYLTVGAFIILLGLLLRVVRYYRAGTPGPNRFGAERLTLEEAARREREKNAEEV